MTIRKQKETKRLLLSWELEHKVNRFDSMCIKIRCIYDHQIFISCFKAKKMEYLNNLEHLKNPYSLVAFRFTLNLHARPRKPLFLQQMSLDMCTWESYAGLSNNFSSSWTNFRHFLWKLWCTHTVCAQVWLLSVISYPPMQAVFVWEKMVKNNHAKFRMNWSFDSLLQGQKAGLGPILMMHYSLLCHSITTCIDLNFVTDLFKVNWKFKHKSALSGAWCGAKEKQQAKRAAERSFTSFCMAFFFRMPQFSSEYQSFAHDRFWTTSQFDFSCFSLH